MDQRESLTEPKDHRALGGEPRVACPKCKGPMKADGDSALICTAEDLQFRKEQNIWRFLLPERQAYFEPFLNDYETVREREGRWSHDPAFYRALPYKDLTGRFVEDWRIRALSYETFVNAGLTPLHNQMARPLQILDLGAGNGWLSNRLKQSGHLPVALDLLTNSSDGLGACLFYREPFPAVQAEIDGLPFEEGAFDVVVFNASLHYSENYQTTLSEAQRVLADDGRLVIIDTPIYHDANSGLQMVREREESFLREFGFRSNALKSENFLTFDRLNELSDHCQISWRHIRPNYGWKWQLKPLLAKARGGREPAQFIVLIGRRV